MAINTVQFPSRPQADTILAVFLLRKFGEQVFPGVSKASISFSAQLSSQTDFDHLLGEGILALDAGGGELDHHNKPEMTLSYLLAKKLHVENDPALEKLFQYVKRDDMFGKGTISNDAIDKAFGLSGLMTTLNKAYPNEPSKTVEIILPIIAAHYIEEHKRTTEMPKEVEEKLKSGKAESFAVRQRDKNLKVIMIESDNVSLSGYLRSQLGGAYDVVALWSSSGHLNIMTRPTKRVDLRSLVALIRAEELKEKGSDRPIDELAQPGKIAEIPEWYFDDKTNSMQNGAIARKDVPATKVEKIALKKILELGLSESLWRP